MHANSILVNVLAAVGTVSAIPLSSPNPAAELFKRADPAPVSCGPTSNERAYPLMTVQDAFNALVANGNTPDAMKPAANGRTYPRQYGGTNATPSDASVTTALDAIPECKTGQTGFKYFEFPLTSPTFVTCTTPMCQGPDRVIAISPNIGPGGTRTFTYCLAITHRGLTGGAFDPCTNSP